LYRHEISHDQLLHSIKAYNPIDQLKPLADAQVPMFLLHGSHDELVPSHENSDLLLNNYQAHRGSVELDRLEGFGHDDSAAFLENQNMLQFLLQSL
jgi:predicted esterase